MEDDNNTASKLMNDEKKEKELNYLLEEIKDTTLDYVGTNGCKYQDLLREELNLLLDYITNLQQENERLKSDFDMCVKNLKKAVEYIKINCITSDKWEDLGFCNFVPTGKITYKQLSKNKINKLLNILNSRSDE